MSSLLLAAGLLVVLVPALYLYLASAVATRFPILRNKRICLLIAHPDDEAMFFAPTVLALTRPETGNHVKILCLSSGDAEGLGETRKKELVKSGMLLGLRQEDDVFVVDAPEFPDSMTATWDAGAISELLTSAFVPEAAHGHATIDALVTFDARGVSFHPNHISLYHGARAFAASLAASSPVDLYSLSTVSLVRKYASVLDAIGTSLVAWALWPASSRAASTGDEGGDVPPAAGGEHEHPSRLVFVSGLAAEGGVPTAWRAMTDAHKSQMVWFRYGWIAFSRYMVVNELTLQDVVAPA